MRRSLFLLGALASLIPGDCRAQEAPPAPSVSGYWWASAGNFDGNDNPGQLEDEGGQYAIVGAVGIRIRPGFAVDIELPYYGADFDAPPCPRSASAR